MKHRRVSVRGVVCDEDAKIFSVRHKKYDGNKFAAKDFWCLPGGGLDIGEDLLTGIEREMIEETGVKPVIGPLLYIQQFGHDDTEYLEFFFHIQNTDDYRQINLASTTHGVEEIAEFGFIDLKTVTFLPEFLTQCNIKEQISKQCPPRVFSRFD